MQQSIYKLELISSKLNSIKVGTGSMCTPNITVYRIVGNFRGRKLVQIGEK